MMIARFIYLAGDINKIYKPPQKLKKVLYFGEINYFSREIILAQNNKDCKEAQIFKMQCF